MACTLSSQAIIRGAGVCPQSSSGKISRARAPRSVSVSCKAEAPKKVATKESNGRREIILNSVNGLFLASVFNFTGDKPSALGLKDYGNFKSLGLCPASPNCISSAEEANDQAHFVPAWTYGKKSKEIAFKELKESVESCTDAKFTVEIIQQTDDYLYATFQSPFFGFMDDVEFFFPSDKNWVEYRSASRLGESDGDINRKRIRALRKDLEKKGQWESVGF